MGRQTLDLMGHKEHNVENARNVINREQRRGTSNQPDHAEYVS